MNWRDDPATEKQLDYLKDFGFVPERPLKKGEASDLISEFSEDPEKQRIRNEAQFKERERNLAHHLRLACDSAKLDLDRAGKGEIRDAKAYLRDVQNERLAFWQHAFQPPDGGEIYQQPIKLYLEHGYRFKMPSSKHFQKVLDALDADSATWDKDVPEYFFQALQHNFPELLRKSPDLRELAAYREVYGEPKASTGPSAKASVKPSGCFSVLVLLVLLVFACLTLFAL
jgi:hypothetical protein